MREGLMSRKLSVFKICWYIYTFILISYYYEQVISLEKHECIACDIQAYVGYNNIFDSNTHLGILYITPMEIDKLDLYKRSDNWYLPLVEVSTYNDTKYKYHLGDGRKFEIQISSKSPVRLYIKNLQMYYCYKHASLFKETCDSIGFVLVDIEHNKLYFTNKNNKSTIHNFGNFNVEIIRKSSYLTIISIEYIAN